MRFTPARTAPAKLPHSPAKDSSSTSENSLSNSPGTCTLAVCPATLNSYSCMVVGKMNMLRPGFSAYAAWFSLKTRTITSPSAGASTE